METTIILPIVFSCLIAFGNGVLILPLCERAEASELV